MNSISAYSKSLTSTKPRSPANFVEATSKVECSTLVSIYSIFSSLAPVIWRILLESKTLVYFNALVHAFPQDCGNHWDPVPIQ